QSQTSEATSIIHATIVEVAAGKDLPDQTVVIEGNRILAVAAFDSAKAPQGHVIDAHGGFLIPGPWDMHVHIQDLEDLPLYIANGVTGVRLMEANTRQACEPNLLAPLSLLKSSSAAPSLTETYLYGQVRSSSRILATRAARWMRSRRTEPTSSKFTMTFRATLISRLPTKPTSKTFRSWGICPTACARQRLLTQAS